MTKAFLQDGKEKEHLSASDMKLAARKAKNENSLSRIRERTHQ